MTYIRTHTQANTCSFVQNIKIQTHPQNEANKSHQNNKNLQFNQITFPICVQSIFLITSTKANIFELVNYFYSQDIDYYRKMIGPVNSGQIHHVYIVYDTRFYEFIFIELYVSECRPLLIS